MLQTDCPALPPWVVLHIPHDAVYVPEALRRTLFLTDDELDAELLRMTDFWTYALFANGIPVSRTAIAPVNRLVVDVERFEDDRSEIMAARGMGAVYTRTSQIAPLRRKPTERQRRKLIEAWYRPHHARLERLVDEALKDHGRALVLDCHSFASKRLPYEDASGAPRPEICIGTDAWHTPRPLARAALESFGLAGFDTAENAPFSGALTPMKHYARDGRVAALMLEVRRDLYEDERTGAMRADFVKLSRSLNRCLQAACESIA